MRETFVCTCGARLYPRQLADHLRDTGETTELPELACPDLFARRRRGEVAA